MSPNQDLEPGRKLGQGQALESDRALAPGMVTETSLGPDLEKVLGRGPELVTNPSGRASTAP